MKYMKRKVIEMQKQKTTPKLIEFRNKGGEKT